MAFPSCSSLVWFEPGADTMVWDGGGWRTPCHTVTLLSVTEGTLQSLAELQEAVLQCPVSDPPWHRLPLTSQVSFPSARQ